MCFCDVSKIVANSKILIISGAPIRVIFQNSVTYHDDVEAHDHTFSTTVDDPNISANA